MLPTPKAASAAPKPAATATLALPAPNTAESAAPAPAASATADAAPVLIPADLVQRVSEYYVQERIYLTKCQQFIIMTSSK